MFGAGQPDDGTHHGVVFRGPASLNVPLQRGRDSLGKTPHEIEGLVNVSAAQLGTEGAGKGGNLVHSCPQHGLAVWYSGDLPGVDAPSH